MSNLCWYALVYEGERCIVYGRAPCGMPEYIVDEIKRSLLFHDLIGLKSKLYFRKDPIKAKTVAEFCEQEAEKRSGDYGDYRVVKLDLRKGRAELAPPPPPAN